MQFLVDENLPRRVARFLQAQGHDAVMVVDTELKSRSDLELWRYAASHNLILLTRDRDFPVRGVEAKPSALILLRTHVTAPHLVSELFEKTWPKIPPKAFTGTIISIQPGRFRTRPL